MKKLLSLVLAIAMIACLAAGCGKTDPTTTGSKNPTGNVDVPGTTAAPTAPTDPIVDPDATYTYNYAMSVFPTNWNYCTYQTATDAEILDYIVDGFYSFDYNETMDGYAMVDAMAVGDPVDVTSQYVGQYGIEEGETSLAYKITIRDDLYWNNGDHITVYDFVESAKRLLAPEAQNYRADSMYSGSVSIYGAESYLKQGLVVLEAADSKIEIYSEDLDASLIFSLSEPKDGNGEVSFRTAFGFPASYDAAACAAYVANNYLAGSAFTVEAAAAMEGKTLAEIKADETMKAAWEALIGWWQTDPNEELDFFLAESAYPEYSWDNVGWVQLSDYELLFVMNKPMSGFYLKYNLFAPLVHLETYDACATIEDGIYLNSYCTSAENTMSYGPYVLTSFQKDKEFTLERNPYYYGKTEDTYQTTHIQVQCVTEATTRLEYFLQGKLDSYGLQKEDMEKYQLSDYTYYATGASTFALVFNPDLEALTSQQAVAGENINKTILTVKEFRMALSFCLDRSAFCLATAPTNGPTFGLYSDLIVSDPEAGTAYRTTQVAKEVLAEFWGVKDSIGTLYEDIDEAIESITGYNLTMGQQMFDKAYDIAIAEGLMDADDTIQICIGTPNNTSTFYNGGYDYLVNCYTEAVKGTKLEGKLTFTRDYSLGNDFATALQNNQVDLLFGVGWSGSALDPYGLMEAYIYTSYQYDPSFDYSSCMVDVEIDGVVYTTDAISWYQIMNGETLTITAADGSTREYACGTEQNEPENRLQILGCLERAVLLNYNFIPLMDNASASMRGMQINYKTEEYIFGMGFGGIKYYTYNYTDAEWDAYVASQGGILDYT